MRKAIYEVIEKGGRAPATTATATATAATITENLKN